MIKIRKEKLKEIWKDPVWSKIIAQGIISLFVLISGFIVLDRFNDEKLSKTKTTPSLVVKHKRPVITQEPVTTEQKKFIRSGRINNKVNAEDKEVKNFEVSGNVYDADSQEYLSNVEVRVGDQVVKTDLNGHFYINLKGVIGESKEIFFSKAGYFPFPSREKINLPEDAIRISLNRQIP